ncbi:MAG: FISUMP domain-containing protein [Ignavibacteriaceae bacterium]|nr:FISUMP domain-containing protein [Ignavibacteriaceae bacterium]
MKLKNILYYLAIIVLLTSQLWATNTNPVVTKVTFSISGSTVTVHYNVSDAEQSSVTISMEVSSDGGTTWNYNFGSACGDIGAGVATGTAKTITWIYSGVHNNQFQIKIIANDLVIDGGPCATATVIYGGKTYNTVQIVNQCWLKENIDVGIVINSVNNQTNNSMIEKYCYNDDPANCTTYGGLYQWAEAVQYKNGATNTLSANPPLSGNVQGICPSDWHIPTNEELQILDSAVSNNGNALKAVGQGTSSGAGTNTSGFSGLLAGYRDYGGHAGYWNIGYGTYLWSSAEYNDRNAFKVSLSSNDSNIPYSYNDKALGFSVRCIKDQKIPSIPNLSTPTNNSTNVSINPTLSWNASIGATSYALQVSTDSTFPNFIYNQSGLTSTSQQVTGLSNQTVYYWRVNASNSYGTSGWSTPTWSFRIIISAPATPTLTSPLDKGKDISITPTLSWNASIGATSYAFQVSRDSTFPNFIYNQSGLTSTSRQITFLSNQTVYYWRVNASNSYGTSGWSSVWNFTTTAVSCSTSTISYSGKNYNTILIGNQCWLKENLDVGTRINGSVDQTNNGIIEKYCYNDDPANCTTYGGLYQWAEAVQYKNGATNTTSPNPQFTGKIQGICPTGWHLPDYTEYQILSSTVNNDGNSLKREDQGIGAGLGTNTSGFSALLAGYRYSDPLFFNYLRDDAYILISSDFTATLANTMSLSDNTNSMFMLDYPKDYGFSVRCIQN